MDLKAQNEKLERFGLGSKHLETLERKALAGPDFDIEHWDNEKGELSQTKAYFKNYELHTLQVTLKSIVLIPEMNIQGIDTGSLDQQMSAINWSSNQATAAIDAVLIEVEPRPESRLIANTVKDLFEVRKHQEDICDRLMMKHWLDSDSRHCFPNRLDHLREKLEKSCTLDYNPSVSLHDVKQVLRGEEVKKALRMDKGIKSCSLGRDQDGRLFMKIEPRANRQFQFLSI